MSGGLKCGNGTGAGYKVTGTPVVFVNDRHINNSDFHGETPEIYHREYVDAVVELLKAGERCIFFLCIHSVRIILSDWSKEQCCKPD